MGVTESREQVQAFFDGWDLYRKVIQQDYMHHRAIGQAVRTLLEVSGAGRLLDLGCGDASTIAAALDGVRSTSYTGVDLSAGALAEAGSNLESLGVAAQLVQADYMAFLGDAVPASFDTVIAGYTVHHLRGRETERFFHMAHRVLAPGGRLLVYDVFREENETTQVINLLAPIHLFLQFWYHTRHIPKLGWLEYVIITPSQHRVHHAINPEYLDKNLGQIFPWWDRMFGTFQEELEAVPPVYGITRPVQTWNPIRINFQHLWLLTKDAWHAEKWLDKARIWFMPTGWRPPDVEARFPVSKIADPYDFQKYGQAAPFGFLAWSWFQFLATILLLFLMLARFGDLESAKLFTWSAFIFLAVFGYTSLMDGLPWAGWLEAARGLTGLLIVLIMGDWLGEPLAVSGLIGTYYLLTAVGSPIVARMDRTPP